MAEAELDLEAHLAPFGLTAFRPGQRDVVATVLSGQDCLCVMPTGGGKSLCYQLPAIARPGVTLVVSPLIALMKDQVDQLQSLGLRATFINSTLAPDEQYRRLDDMAAGLYDLVYVVPERFRSGRFLDAVRRCNLQLLAIDEAHCVSEWGHDFRPDYAKLGRFREQLGNPTTIALTATATDTVRQDIIKLLRLNEPKSFITGFARSNLHYAVGVASSQREKDDLLIDFLAKHPGTGIVYASTRKRCEEVAQTIAQRSKRKTGIYHAGLSGEERHAAQNAFMQGRVEVVVATLAFGMGIDKQDVRFVVHYNLPGSLEGYYQEVGRAGRDGNPSNCLLLYSASDRYIHEFFIESAYPSREVVEQVYDFFCESDDNPIELTQQEVKEQLGLQVGGDAVGTCEKLLEKAGVLERLEPNENMAAVRLNSDLPTLVDLLPPQAKVKRRVVQAIESLVGPQRREWVYFQPQDLIKRAELEPATVSRTLRELNQLASFDYIAPFRGRAIHVSDRERPFDNLEIDFDSIERRKSAEYERLAIMVHFAQTRHCRQTEILRYFGEANPQPCGHCDNCDRLGAGTGATSTASAPSAGVSQAARIVLSGVARSRGHYGKTMIAQMLCGSASEKITRFRLDRLSTYGLLKHLKQTEVVELIDALLAALCLEQTELERFRPLLNLTELGAEVMAGRQELTSLVLPATLDKKLRKSVPTDSSGQPAAANDDDLDPDLVSRLRQWRNATASERGAPGYTVLSNATIDELARERPQSLDAMGRVKGIGEAKLRQYGETLLTLLAGVSPTNNPARETPRVVADNADLGEQELGESDPGGPDLSDDEFAFTASTSEPDAGWEEAAGAIEAEIEEATASQSEVAPPAFDAAPSPHAAPLPQSAEKTALTDSAPPPQSSGAQPSHYWTWRLLSTGFSPSECGAIRSLTEEVVLDHALRALDSGWPVEPEVFLSAALIEKLSKVVGDQSPTRIRPLLAKLPTGTRYEEVLLFLKCRQQRSSQS